MNKIEKLPDAEFEVMKVIWANTPPVTTNIVMEQLGDEKGWKAQTAVTLLLRLVERGFLRKEKRGREGLYFPLVNREDYLKFETSKFVKQYHNNSILGLVNTMYGDKALSGEDIDELIQWAKERRK